MIVRHQASAFSVSRSSEWRLGPEKVLAYLRSRDHIRTLSALLPMVTSVQRLAVMRRSRALGRNAPCGNVVAECCHQEFAALEHVMTGRISVLLVDADRERRLARIDALRARGLFVSGVGGIAEITTWPRDVVVTAQSHSPLLWKYLGAAFVIVVVDSPERGRAACAEGADAWLPYWCEADDLVRVIVELHSAPPSADT
jgi:hypothetical protein